MGERDDVEVIELVKPMTSGFLEREIAKRQLERQGEIDSMEAEMADVDEEEFEASGALERLEELRSMNGTNDAEAILAANTVKIALRSIPRRRAYARGNLQSEAKDWLAEASGAGGFEDVDIKSIPDDVGEVWTAMYQAADIVAALVPDQCEGWEVPEDLEGWADVKDWIFQRALSEAWALNPQMILGQLSGEA